MPELKDDIISADLLTLTPFTHDTTASRAINTIKVGIA
jgi:hypothetical protein